MQIRLSHRVLSHGSLGQAGHIADGGSKIDHRPSPSRGPDRRGAGRRAGRDDRGRKQCRYHARRRAVRNETKYDRMLAFGQVLPAGRKAD